MKVSTDTLLLQFKALADPMRLRIVALCRVVECSVSELKELSGLSQPRVSQHLKQLCGAGLLERFRDGHFVFYRASVDGGDAAYRRQLLALLPDDEPQFEKDIARLRQIRGGDDAAGEPVSNNDRSLHRALVELTVVRPLGDLLDIGCGQGRILKLLASRAQRVVGVDIDSNARRLARAQLLLAGVPNCSLRQGNMSQLPFDDAEFDTVILDDVLTAKNSPLAVLSEATRLLKPGGQLLLLCAVGDTDIRQLKSDLAAWAAESKLRLGEPRSIPTANPAWVLAVATPAGLSSVAA